MCLHHVDVIPGAEIGREVITDIAILNPGESDVEFPPGSTAVVGVNEIMPGGKESHGHGAEAGTNQPRLGQLKQEANVQKQIE